MSIKKSVEKIPPAEKIINIEDLLLKEHLLDEQIMKAQLRREEIYNKLVLQQNQTKKQSSVIVPMFIGVGVAFLVNNWDSISNIL